MSPLRTSLLRRPLDLALVAFFLVNLLLTTYVVSLEQIVIDDPFRYVSPPWPPETLLRLVHWWERNYDPLLIARPAWYRATIWLDVLFFGPFYVAAIYAFVKERNWIRIPVIIWASSLSTNVIIILFDELLGEHATPSPFTVVSANAPWLFLPWIVVWRVLRAKTPFPSRAGSEEYASGAPAP